MKGGDCEIPLNVSIIYVSPRIDVWAFRLQMYDNLYRKCILLNWPLENQKNLFLNQNGEATKHNLKSNDICHNLQSALGWCAQGMLIVSFPINPSSSARRPKCSAWFHWAPPSSVCYTWREGKRLLLAFFQQLSCFYLFKYTFMHVLLSTICLLSTC